MLRSSTQQRMNTPSTMSLRSTKSMRAVPSVDVVRKNDMNDLLNAYENGDMGAVQYLLEHGANVNSMNQFGQTPLMLACMENRLTIVQLLLDNGSDIHAREESGATSLMLACKVGHCQVTQYLLKRGANVDIVDHDSRTPLFYAALGGHLNVVQCLCNLDADINARDECGETPMMAAAQYEHMHVAKYLLELGAQTDMAKTVHPLMSLMTSAYENEHEFGSKTSNVFQVRDSRQATPLMYSAYHGHEQLTMFIGMAPMVDSSGYTALHYAACQNQIKALTMLLDIVDIQAQSHNGETALHVATMVGASDAVSVLLKHIEVDVSPLAMRTIEMDDTPTFKVFCAYYAKKKKDMNELLDKVLQCKQQRLIPILMDAGMEIGSEALVKGVKWSDVRCLRALINGVSHSGRSSLLARPLKLSVREGKVDMIEMLLHGKRVSDELMTSMVDAMKHNKKAVSECLIRHGARVEVAPATMQSGHMEVEPNVRMMKSNKSFHF